MIDRVKMEDIKLREGDAGREEAEGTQEIEKG